MRAASILLGVLLGMQFAAPSWCETAKLDQAWEEPTEALTDDMVVDKFKDYCISSALDFSSVASRLNARGAKRVDQHSVTQLFSGVRPHGRVGYVLDTGVGTFTVLLGVSGDVLAGQKRLARSGQFAETLPVSVDRELSFLMNSVPENTIGQKSCTIIARVNAGWALVPKIQELEVDGTGVSDWNVRSVEKGPTEKLEPAMHWFGSIGPSTLNMVSRINQDGTSTVRIVYSSFISGSDPKGSYNTDGPQ